MTWSSELEKDAEKWAKKLADTDQFKHDQLDDVSLLQLRLNNCNVIYITFFEPTKSTSGKSQ